MTASNENCVFAWWPRGVSGTARGTSGGGRRTDLGRDARLCGQAARGGVRETGGDRLGRFLAMRLLREAEGKATDYEAGEVSAEEKCQSCVEVERRRRRRRGHDGRDSAADFRVFADGVAEEPARVANEGVKRARAFALESDLEAAACAERELLRGVAAHVPRHRGAEEVQHEGEAVLLVPGELLRPRHRVVMQGDDSLVLGRELR